MSSTRNTYVALLRGVNVGGKNILPMKALATMFEAAQCTEVRTYIQSGNVVFCSSPATAKTIAQSISDAITRKFKFKSPVVLRSLDELDDVINNNPFLQTGAPESNLHVLFLTSPPGEEVASLDPNRSPGDSYEVRGREIYLNLPNGAGRTKLTNDYFERLLKTVSTGRNWRTVLKVREMMRSQDRLD